MICHLTSVHKRYDVRIFQKICTSLAREGYEVFLLVADGKGEEEVNGVKIKDVGQQPSRIKRLFISSGKLLKMALELDCNVYHIHDPELLPVALKLKKQGKRVIFDSHEYLPGQIMDKPYLPKILRKSISNLVELYFKKNLPAIDAIFTVTPHILDKLSSYSDKVYLLTNYPIRKDYIHNNSEVEYLNKRNKIFYAGTIYETSQQSAILDALEEIREVEYLLIGNIDQKYKNRLMQKRAWGRVNYLEYMSKEELDVKANEATIGVAIFDYIPNLGGKMGSLGVNKIFEYMLYGLPVICTDFELWKVIVDKYECGLYVNPNDTNEMAQAINYLVTNKAEAYKMGQNGRKAVQNEYNWHEQEKQLLTVYAHLLYSN